MTIYLSPKIGIKSTLIQLINPNFGINYQREIGQKDTHLRILFHNKYAMNVVAPIKGNKL